MSTTVRRENVDCLVAKGRDRATVDQTSSGTASEATPGKLLSDGVERIIMGFSERVDVIRNRTPHSAARSVFSVWPLLFFAPHFLFVAS